MTGSRFIQLLVTAGWTWICSFHIADQYQRPQENKNKNDELWCLLAQYGLFGISVKFDHENQGHPPPPPPPQKKKNRYRYRYRYLDGDGDGDGGNGDGDGDILVEEFCDSGQNLVTLGWKRDELSCRQASDRYTQGHIYTQAKTMTIHEGQNWHDMHILPQDIYFIEILVC